MKSFDFIIIGGGTSGTVTAAKLVKNGHSVLLLEEGGKNSNPLLSMPAGWIPMLDGSPYLKFYKSIAQPQLNNRQHDIAQAKILGGGSSINGMVYMRGKPSDYQKWVDETGDERWSWQSLLSSYKKLEDNQRLSGNFHGTEGFIKVSDPGYVAKGSDLYIKSMQNLGLHGYEGYRNFLTVLTTEQLITQAVLSRHRLHRTCCSFRLIASGHRDGGGPHAIKSCLDP